jgi:hypothetical protein
VNGVTYDCTKETIFVIATSSPVKAIKIPRVCSETIQESRADRIEKKADEALSRIPAIVRCSRAFVVTSAVPLQVQFTSTDCPGKDQLERNGWSFGPSLANTDLCGGFSEFNISEDIADPKIIFFGGRPSDCFGKTSSVTVNYIGVRRSERRKQHH